MKTYTLPPKTIACDDSWDVIVVGGGPAGCAAATAAARQGARTLLLEMNGVLGGMGTAGLVPWFCGYDDGQRIVARGLAETVRLQLAEGMPHFKEQLQTHELTPPPIDPERLKRIYDEMVTGAGATVRFHSGLCGVECDGSGNPETLWVASKDGLKAFRAKIFVDCTGDADLAAWAGAEVLQGDDQGALQPATHCFIICNIDEEALAKGPNIHFYDADSPIWKAVASDKYPLIEELHSCNRKLGPGVFGFNTGHLFDVDNTDPASISQSLLKGRQMVYQYHQALREYLPAFRDSFLVLSGYLMGVRETRRVVGDYWLTVEDYRNQRSFDDEICRNSYGVDVHGSREQALANAKRSIPEIKDRIRKIVRRLPAGENFGVPYRCLTPRNISNLLVAGRCISTDREANGTVRIMACCLNTGEAAGIAAAMAAAGAMDVHQIDTDALRSTLRQNGAYLP